MSVQTALEARHQLGLGSLARESSGVCGCLPCGEGRGACTQAGAGMRVSFQEVEKELELHGSWSVEKQLVFTLWAAGSGWRLSNQRRNGTDAHFRKMPGSSVKIGLDGRTLKTMDRLGLLVQQSSLWAAGPGLRQAVAMWRRGRGDVGRWNLWRLATGAAFGSCGRRKENGHRCPSCTHWLREYTCASGSVWTWEGAASKWWRRGDGWKHALKWSLTQMIQGRDCKGSTPEPPGRARQRARGHSYTGTDRPGTVSGRENSTVRCHWDVKLGEVK